MEITKERASRFLIYRDRIANLQLLEGVPNEEKRAAPFDAWLKSTFKTEQSRQAYFSQNHIPSDVSPRFDDFEDFVRERERMLYVAIKKLVKID